MQDLDIISINIWHIVISLANLVILFLILKKLLFKPVKKIVEQRRKELDAEYRKAEKTQAEADATKAEWEGKMASVEAEADKIIDIERERKDARETIKKEIVDVSQALSEQIIGREINMDDHRDLIDRAIDRIGEQQ